MQVSHSRGAYLLVAALFLSTAALAIPSPSIWNRTNLVDTRIGSGGGGWGIGNLNPGAQVPFGAMRLGPDTSLGLEPFRLEFNDMGGYYYPNNHIECFSHTHVVGAGEGDFQNFGVMVTRQLNNDVVTNCGYRSMFSHDQEVAKPGYYATNLLDPNVYAEVTVSGTHSGMHRYTARQTWPENLGAPTVIIDMCHGVTKNFMELNIGDSCINAQLLNMSLSADGVSYDVDAWVFNEGGFSQSSNRGGIDIYFHAHISAFSVTPNNASYRVPLSLTMSSWQAGVVQVGTWIKGNTTSGSLGAAFTVAPTSELTEIIVRSGISFVSSANARANLYTQQTSSNGKLMTFDDAVASTVNIWEKHHETIIYSGGVASSNWHRTVFDTALYHTVMPPTIYSESNGEYLGEDWDVHTVAPGHRYLSDLSIWDIYRTQAPFLLIAKPTVAIDLVNSMLEMIRETQELPVWVFANVETYCMVGHHSAVIFADYVMKGLPNIDTAAILAAVVSNITAQNQQQLSAFGFVPVEANQRGASLTQDFALDAGAAANLAAFLGDNASAEALSVFAKAYRNVWNNETTFFCPRHENGTFACDDPYWPYPLEVMFTEGNGAEYRWYVPHDIDGMMALFPNRTYFVDQLDTFFSLSELWIFNTTFPNPAYWAGNEPDILAPFLFLFAGNEFAYLTSYWVPTMLDRYYIPYASGIPGNDDYGTMSTWVVYSYIGIYPVASTDLYGLFAPRFDSIDVTLDATEFAVSPWNTVVKANTTVGGRTTIIRIRAYNRPECAEGSACVSYVSSIKLNGKVLSSSVVRHSDLLDVGNESSTLLEFTLSAIPTVLNEAPSAHGGPEVFIPSRMSWSPEDIASKRSEVNRVGSELEKQTKRGREMKDPRFSPRFSAKARHEGQRRDALANKEAMKKTKKNQL